MESEQETNKAECLLFVHSTLFRIANQLMATLSARTHGQTSARFEHMMENLSVLCTRSLRPRSQQSRLQRMKEDSLKRRWCAVINYHEKGGATKTTDHGLHRIPSVSPPQAFLSPSKPGDEYRHRRGKGVAKRKLNERLIISD